MFECSSVMESCGLDMVGAVMECHYWVVVFLDASLLHSPSFPFTFGICLGHGPFSLLARSERGSF